MSIVRGLLISPHTGGSALTPEQKRFNNLIRQIEQLRRTLADWQENIPLYVQAHTQVVVPLMQALAAVRREWAFALDRVLGQPGWTKAERAALRELLCTSASELLHASDEDDAALRTLFDKYAAVDFETGQQRSRNALKDMVETMTGVELGDDSEFASDEDLMSRLQQRLAADAERAQAAEPPNRRRKTTAAQQRRESEAQLATQSVREVFRKLASALHPDRETDPAKRDAKTALMQKVNQAYQANDLLTLLELQLQIEQVDAGHIASASVQRLRHYNKVLSEQLAELRAEVERVESGFCFDFGLEPGRSMNPKKLFGSIDGNARQLRVEVAEHQREVRLLEDKVATKRWLVRQRRRLREDAFIEELLWEATTRAR